MRFHTWYHNIANLDFINNHLNQSIAKKSLLPNNFNDNDPNNVNLVCQVSNEHSLYMVACKISSDHTLTRIFKFKFPHPGPDALNHFDIVGVKL